MFTLEEIKEVHSQVKSGADFPGYIHDLIALGVTKSTTYVADGHTEYFGRDNFRIQSDARYDVLEIAETGETEQFEHCLKIHQQGQTDFPTFCRHCAESGVVKWTVTMNDMHCTYYDTEGNEMVVEKIPGEVRPI